MYSPLLTTMLAGECFDLVEKRIREMTLLITLINLN